MLKNAYSNIDAKQKAAIMVRNQKMDLKGHESVVPVHERRNLPPAEFLGEYTTNHRADARRQHGPKIEEAKVATSFFGLRDVANDSSAYQSQMSAGKAGQAK